MSATATATHLSKLPPRSVDQYVVELANDHGPSPFSWPAVSAPERLADLTRWALEGEKESACPARERDYVYVHASELHRAMLWALLDLVLVRDQEDRWGDRVRDEDERAAWRQAEAEARALLALDWRAPVTDSIGLLALLRSWSEFGAADEAIAAE